jgi:hypothetical protein
LIGGARSGVLLPALREAAPGLALESLPERCPVEIAEAAAPAWRNATTVTGLALAASGAVRTPLIEFAVNTEAQAAAASARGAVHQLAPWAGATAALLLTAAGIDHARLQGRRDRLEAEAMRVYRLAMHDDSAVGQRMKMEARLAELERQSEATGGSGAGSPLAVLTGISAALPPDVNVEFELYSYDPPNAHMRGNADTFEAVTRLQDVLRASGRFENVEVSDVRAAVAAGVQFELAVTLATEEPT